VLRKVEIKQVDNEWLILLENMSADGSAAPASDKAAQIQDSNVNTIQIVGLY